MLAVCLTACIWIFHDEITVLLEPKAKIQMITKNQPARQLS